MSKKKDIRLTIRDVERGSTSKNFELDTPLTDTPTTPVEHRNSLNSPSGIKKFNEHKLVSAIKGFSKSKEFHFLFFLKIRFNQQKDVTKSPSKKIDLTKYDIKFGISTSILNTIESLILYPELNKDVTDYVCEEFKLDSYAPLRKRIFKINFFRIY
jgi:hypothetical protein